MTTMLRSNAAGFVHLAYTLRALSQSTIFLATSGKRPSSTNDPISPGDTSPASESICAICVPAFTYTIVPSSMPTWLTQ